MVIDCTVCPEEQHSSRTHENHKQMHVLRCNQPTEPFHGLSPSLQDPREVELVLAHVHKSHRPPYKDTGIIARRCHDGKPEFAAMLSPGFSDTV